MMHDDDRVCGFGYQRDNCLLCSQLRVIAMCATLGTTYDDDDMRGYDDA